MRFLHIEDNAAHREMVQEFVSKTPHWRYHGASTIAEGLRLWRNEAANVVLIDIAFPGRPDAEAYDAIAEMAPQSCVIAVSGNTSQQAVNAARDAGATAFINKDEGAMLSPRAFHDSVQKYVEKNVARGLRDENASERALAELMNAMYIGNGRPSVLARLEGGDVRMAGIERGVAELKATVETGIKDVATKQEGLRAQQEERRTEVNGQMEELRNKIDAVAEKSASLLKRYALWVPVIYIAAYFVLNVLAMFLDKPAPHMPTLKDIGIHGE